MKRRLAPHDAAIWAIVAVTVRPLAGRAIDQPESRHAKTRASPPPATATPPVTGPRAIPTTPRPPPQTLEPRRYQRLARGRDDLGARLDLHGHGHDSARSVLTSFLISRHADGARSVLVITGKGVLGDGVLRRRVPEWLGQAPLRGLVAGVSEAHRRHGGEGALYVALKRRDRF